MYTYVSYIFTNESFLFVYSGMLYILFALLLGAVCSRHALLTDYMIASKVSLVGVLFLFGLYISSLSSCLGAQYGAPRVLQCISKENVLPIIKPLGKGVRILGLQPGDKATMLTDKKNTFFVSQHGGGEVSCKLAIATFTTFFCRLFTLLVGTNDSCLGTVKAPTSTPCCFLDLHMSVINY